jgi:hypothetical protein
MWIGRVNYRSWLLRILTWDTILPVAVAFVPTAIALFLPNRRGVMEIASVTLPIAAFLLRLRIGKRQIDSNRCSVAVRKFQFCVFFVGILPLVLIDCVIILSHLMPNGALFATSGDLLVWAILAAIYLASMTVAMYPGSAGAANDQHESDDYSRGHDAGRQWAMEEAQADELIRLANWKEEAGNHSEDGLVLFGQSAREPQDDFIFTINPDTYGDRRESEAFWEWHSGMQCPSGEFVQGFAEGALEIWGEECERPSEA